MKFAHIFLFLLVATGCNDYPNKRYPAKYKRQQIELRDSLFIIHTIRVWTDSGFFTWQALPKLYNIDLNNVSFFVDACFYSPDKRKLVAWAGLRTPNGATRQTFNHEKAWANRLCPTGRDTIYQMDGLIGFRESANGLWKLYPFGKQGIGCANSLKDAEEIMSRWYFDKMPQDQFYSIPQSGPNKGEISDTPYAYSVLDTNFWTESPVWEKDTIRSYGLYPFQVENYAYGVQALCKNKDCANPFQPPKVQYPKYLLQMFACQ